MLAQVDVVVAAPEEPAVVAPEEPAVPSPEEPAVGSAKSKECTILLKMTMMTVMRT